MVMVLFLNLLLSYLRIYNFLNSKFLRFSEQTGITSKSFPPWPHHQSPGGGAVIDTIFSSVPNLDQEPDHQRHQRVL